MRWINVSKQRVLDFRSTCDDAVGLQEHHRIGTVIAPFQCAIDWRERAVVDAQMLQSIGFNTRPRGFDFRPVEFAVLVRIDIQRGIQVTQGNVPAHRDVLRVDVQLQIRIARLVCQSDATQQRHAAEKQRFKVTH